ncbi:MFS transporter [Actinomadura sp. CNU-125]|uniref:MFS transporter n=1 Tax=Actinomadura sp. CNU-125 TaxID=1904961 RepID=UPI0021CCD2A7|nr:MFS transporter [Actinomadura sp. CNU-125]
MGVLVDGRGVRAAQRARGPAAGAHRREHRALKGNALVLAVVLLSSFTSPLTITGVSVALPDIRADLGAGLTASQWVITGYNACFASFLVAMGSLADVAGRRRVFAGGVAVFCATGLAAAASQDVLTLNAVRVLGGVGAAASATGGSAILAATFHGTARVRAVGLLGTVLGAGLAFGPTVGGLLVETLGWRAAFGAPAALAGLVLLFVPRLPAGRGEPGRRIDWAGAALFTGALLALITSIVEGGERGFGAPLVLAGFVLAAALAAAFAAVERRTDDPMFELALLANRRFSSYAVAAGSIVFVLVPMLVYLPSYLISVVGLDAGEAGLWLLMLTAPTVVLPTAGAALAKRIPAGPLVAGSVAVTGAGALLLVTIGPGSTPWALAVPLALTGAGFGLSTGLLDGLAVTAVRPEQAGTAAGMFSTARLAAETIAIAVVGAALAVLSGDRLAGAHYTDALRVVCAALAVFAAVATACVLALSRRPAGRGAVPGG